MNISFTPFSFYPLHDQSIYLTLSVWNLKWETRNKEEISSKKKKKKGKEKKNRMWLDVGRNCRLANPFIWFDDKEWFHGSMQILILGSKAS